MKRRSVLMLVACAVVLLLPGTVLSQERAKVVSILGQPEVERDRVSVLVSAFDPNTDSALTGLTADQFTVVLNGEEVAATDVDVDSHAAGLALVVVVDRGGMSRPGDRRMGETVQTLQLMNTMLKVDGSAGADMVALVGIRGEGQAGLAPLLNFTDSDWPSVHDAITGMLAESVPEATPLYDGLEAAIELIINNPDPEIRAKLADRRPLITLTSDGLGAADSDQARWASIVGKCLEHNIPIYATGMVLAKGETAPGLNQIALATNGSYRTWVGFDDQQSVDDATAGAATILTHHQAYRIAFPLHLPEGTYPARVTIADVGQTNEFGVTSELKRLEMVLPQPASGEDYSVPYNTTLDIYERTPISLKVLITPTDGIARDPEEVRYFANGELIATGTIPPDFQAEVDLAQVYDPVDEERSEEWALAAQAVDPFLDEAMESSPVNVRITWGSSEPVPEPEPQPQPEPVPEPEPQPDDRALSERIGEYLAENWWAPLLALLAVGCLVLVILLLRRPGERKPETRRPAPPPRSSGTQALGRLNVVQGPRLGEEAAVGDDFLYVSGAEMRGPLAFVLDDPQASTPHFSITFDQGQFFIKDEGSAAMTFVNGQSISAGRFTTLESNAIIRAGSTTLQFKRLAGGGEEAVSD